MRSANGQALLVAIESDGNAGDVLHNEVRLAVGSAAGVEDLGDSGMIHARERLAFRFEALQENVVGHTGANELPRYETAQGSGLLRKPHLPMPTFAELLNKSIRTDRSGFGCGTIVRGTDSRRCYRRTGSVAGGVRVVYRRCAALT